jgi:hypothetical protein
MARLMISRYRFLITLTLPDAAAAIAEDAISTLLMPLRR